MGLGVNLVELVEAALVDDSAVALFLSFFLTGPPPWALAPDGPSVLRLRLEVFSVRSLSTTSSSSSDSPSVGEVAYPPVP